MSNELLAVGCLVIACFGVMIISLVRLKAMMDQEVSWMSDRLTDMKTDITEALAGIRRTLDGLTERINVMEAKMKALNKRLVDVEDVVIQPPMKPKASRKKDRAL
jgi:hypothetical protein